MTTNKDFNEQELWRGQAELLSRILAFSEPMALKCAVELGIADIINSHGGQLSLTQIASKVTPPLPDPQTLVRVMQLLAHMNILIATPDSKTGETLYGLTPASMWLLHGSNRTMIPVLQMLNHPLFLSPWHHLSRSITGEGTPFEMAHGKSLYGIASSDPEFNRVVNEGMVCFTNMVLPEIIEGYKEGFSRLRGSLVDVGGGHGAALAKIVKAYPHIKGINFDLPHVVGTAPQRPGVTHVGGDMFEVIPTADNVLIKEVLHNWTDEDCVKILTNCRKAIAKETGKLIMIELVLNPQGKDMKDEVIYKSDLLMMAVCSGGKERSQLEWSSLLKSAGFARCNFVQIPCFPCVIEAYPH